MTNPRRTRQHTRIATLAQRVARLPTKLNQAWYAADLTLPDGYPTGTGEHVTGGHIGRPVEAAVLGRENTLDSRLDHDDHAHQRGMTVVDEQLAVIEQAMAAIENELTKLVAPLTRSDPLPRSNVTSCEGCERPIAGTPGDRKRHGYCSACDMAWNREGRPDRTAFNRRRRARAAQADHAKTLVLDRDTAGVDLWVAGQEATLTGDLAAEYRQLEREHGTVPIDDIRRLHHTALNPTEQEATP